MSPCSLLRIVMSDAHTAEKEFIPIGRKEEALPASYAGIRSLFLAIKTDHIAPKRFFFNLFLTIK